MMRVELWVFQRSTAKDSTILMMSHKGFCFFLKCSVTPVIDGQSDFVQNNQTGVRTIAMGKWELIATEQNGRGGVCGYKITKTEYQRDSGQTNLARFLMKMGRGDWIAPEGWWTMKNRSDTRVGQG